VWTPATIFLVTEHLHHLLVRNMFRRDQIPGALLQLRPCRCPAVPRKAPGRPDIL